MTMPESTLDDPEAAASAVSPGIVFPGLLGVPRHLVPMGPVRDPAEAEEAD